MRSTGGTVGSASTEERSDGVSIRPLEECDLSAADRVYRLAFGMQFGLPDPMQYRGDAQILRPRWATTPGATFVAELNGEVVGSITGMDWGQRVRVGAAHGSSRSLGSGHCAPAHSAPPRPSRHDGEEPDRAVHASPKPEAHPAV